MTHDSKDTIDNAKPYDQQPSHEAVKERPTALKTVKNGDEIIAQIGNPAGLTIAWFWHGVENPDINHIMIGSGPRKSTFGFDFTSKMRLWE